MSFCSRAFIFDGVPSEEFNLVIVNIGSKKQDSGTIGTELEILEDRIPRRYKAIHYGTANKDSLSFPIVFSVNKDNAFLDRYDVARIAAWLKPGHQEYKQLVIDQDDMAGIYYNCIITELTQIEAGDRIVGFEATVTCDSPFAYRVMPDTVIKCSDSLTTTYRCNSNIDDYYYPDMTIETSAKNLSITNNADGSKLVLSDMPAVKKTINISGESLVMTSSDGTNLYDCWNKGIAKQAFRALRGDNQLTISGACTITIKNEFPWNIGY